MNLIQIIKSTGVIDEKNLDGEKVVSMAKGDGLNKYTVQNMCAPGFEFSPADGEKLVVVPINGSDSYMVTIAGANENITPDTLKGERKIYSVSEDGAEIKAFAKFKNTGIIELNGNDNFAVLFNELKTEFNKLQQSHNDLVSAYNAHIHITTATIGLSPVGVISPTESSSTPSTAVIDNSKSESVLLKSNPSED